MLKRQRLKITEQLKPNIRLIVLHRPLNQKGLHMHRTKGKCPWYLVHEVNEGPTDA
jgi:hypothetical protein